MNIHAHAEVWQELMQGFRMHLHASSADQKQFQKAASMLRLRLAIQEGGLKQCLDNDIAEDVCELITCIGQGVSVFHESPCSCFAVLVREMA